VALAAQHAVGFEDVGHPTEDALFLYGRTHFIAEEKP
jgi:hypothetical protein